MGLIKLSVTFFTHIISKREMAKVECVICSKIFKKSFLLKQHRRVHTEEKPYQCDVWKKHRRVHTGEKPFQCNICKKSFRQKSNLIRHQRSHTDDKPFICNICEKEFSQMESLMRHRKTHTGEKGFKCNTCGKLFGRKIDLVRHQTVHTEERPFECYICNKKLKSPVTLFRHKRIHTGEKLYIKCDVCDAVFKHANNRLRHIKQNHDPTPFHCDQCSRKYIFKRDLDHHKRKHQIMKTRKMLLEK